MDLSGRNNEYLRTGFRGVRSDAHEAGDIEIDLVNRIWGDLPVAEVEDVGVEPCPDPWSGEILNAAEASLEEKREQQQGKHSEAGC